MGRYDHSRQLVIDPILDYSTYLGPDDGATGIAVDAAGNSYITGKAFVDMPTTAGSYQPSFPTKNYPAERSVYVAKLNSTGTSLLYCTYIGGNGDDVPKRYRHRLSGERVCGRCDVFDRLPDDDWSIPKP